MTGFTMKVFGGTSNPTLSEKIAESLGKPLSKMTVSKFADGEIGVQIHENVRGCDVFIIQPTCTPVNDNMMELCLILDAMKRSSAKRITAVLAYYGYARQDRKTKPRVPISAALVARLIESAGADRVLSVDLHCGQIQGFFKIPVDNLYAKPVLVSELIKRLVKDRNTTENSGEFTKLVVVSPDAGGAERADSFRNDLNESDFFKDHVAMAVMNKRRVEANVVESMELVGDVENCDCVIVDDMIDTAGTLTKCAQVLKDNGAKKIYACATHALLNGSSVDRIQSSVIDVVFVTDTVPISDEKRRQCTKLVEVSASKLIAEAIRRVHNEESISILF
jgi:ribose-phosphate pyrophosphokinase